MIEQGKSKFIILKICVIAALAGFLFGLDVAYVNGALPFIVRDFHLSVEDSGNVAGYLLMGAAFGALISGWLSRQFGRKKVLILAGLIFTFVTILGSSAQTFTIFLSARFVMGLALGIASFVTPLYLSEIAPFKLRGQLVSIYQLMITIGIFVMFLSNTALMQTGSWRLMMVVLVIPSAIMLLGVFGLPESPRWKVLVGKISDAKAILYHIRESGDDAEFELNEITNTVNQKQTSGLQLLCNKYFIKVVLLGMLLQILQQFSGINAVMYYSSQIFETAGFTNPIIGTVVVGLVNMLTTVIAIKYVDRLGRKPILYFGLIILILSCIIIGYLFNLQLSGVVLSDMLKFILLVSCLAFIFGFAISLGPIVWIICSEIFPLGGRELGVGITTMTNWVCNAIIGSYALVWFNNFGVGQTFWIFGLACILGLVLVKWFTPETKNVPLEELEANLYSGQQLSKIGHRTNVG